MKKFLNGMGVFGSIILTIILSILMFVYALILNVKTIISPNGMANTLKRVDVVDALKMAEDGVVWEDFMQLADNLNLTEEQFEQILNSNKVKEELGNFLGEIASSVTSEKRVKITKEKVKRFFNIAVDEYNKVSDTKISDEERQLIMDSFDEEMLEEMNEAIESMNLKEEVDYENVKYVEFADNLLFGSYTLNMLGIIVLIIGLIALFRFSYYKWMSYVKVSAIISGIFILAIGLILSIIPMQDMEILIPLKNVMVINLFITVAILFVIAIALSIGKKYLKKYIQNKKEKTNEIENNENVSELEQVDNSPKKFDKKTLIIIGLIIILLLMILFLIFGRKENYTIVFDTDGGTEISGIEIKNNEIINLPTNPEKEGYSFAYWVNENGNIVTKGTKVTEDTTVTAKWISNESSIRKIEFDTDGGAEIDSIIIEKGEYILLPVEPTRKGYIFIGWIDVDGNLITEDMRVKEDISLKAMWVKKGTKVSTVKFDTDGGSRIGSIVVENGKIILLPVNPRKEGYAFAGWVDENGNAITKDTIVDENMTIIATWKDLYTCPEDCTPIEDGSKCTKEKTTSMINQTSCPSGSILYNTWYGSGSYCINLSTKEDANIRQCDTWEAAEVVYKDSNGKSWCVKTVNKVYTKGCPSGYTQSGDICKKTETINCTAN